MRSWVLWPAAPLLSARFDWIALFAIVVIATAHIRTCPESSSSLPLSADVAPTEIQTPLCALRSSRPKKRTVISQRVGETRRSALASPGQVGEHGAKPWRFTEWSGRPCYSHRPEVGSDVVGSSSDSSAKLNDEAVRLEDGSTLCTNKVLCRQRYVLRSTARSASLNGGPWPSPRRVAREWSAPKSMQPIAPMPGSRLAYFLKDRSLPKQ
jgi:hypothetical protein